MTFTTDLVTCIVIYVALLISPELPNTEKADVQKRLQLTTLKKIEPYSCNTRSFNLRTL